MIPSVYNFEYNCISKVSCQPHIFHANPGRYFLEVWGGQGGNISSTTHGGKGGYSSGIITFVEQTTLFIFIGSGGFVGSTTGLTECSYNGGGRGSYTSLSRIAASGGGGTDIRLNMSLDGRILVAGGGGGSARFDSIQNSGGCGGGIIGGDGYDGYNGGTYYQKGNGGGSSEGGFGNGERSGSFGFGGNQTGATNYGSGGGGGYYGAGAGHLYGSSGGGGSGYVDIIFSNNESISGCSNIPSYYNGFSTSGNSGDGKARITLLVSKNHMTCINFKTITLSIFVSIFFSITTT